MVKCSYKCFIVLCLIMIVFIYYMCRYLWIFFIFWNILEKILIGGSCYVFMGFILLLKKFGLVVFFLYGNCVWFVKMDVCVDGLVEIFVW